MKDLKELTKDVERDLVVSIALGLRHLRITQSQARDLSKSFMSNFPFGDYESLFSSLENLANDFKEVRKVYVKYAERYFQEKNANTLFAMRFYMNKSEIDKAINIAKGGK